MVTPSSHYKVVDSRNIRRTTTTPSSFRSSSASSVAGASTSSNSTMTPQNYSGPPAYGTSSNNSNNNKHRMNSSPRGSGGAVAGSGSMNNRYREPPSPSGSEGFFPQAQQQQQRQQQKQKQTRRSQDDDVFTGNSDQLMHQKEQWNVRRDIPSGTVKNNPFLPQPKPVAPQPVQLAHQKKQWDTSGIPKGRVAANKVLLSQQQQQELEQRTTSQSPRTAGNNSPRTSTESYYRGPKNGAVSSPGGNISGAAEFPSPGNGGGNVKYGGTGGGRVVVQLQPKTSSSRHPHLQQHQAASRGRMIENPTTAGVAPVAATARFTSTTTTTTTAAATTATKSWQPSREIPNGTVKAKTTTLLGSSNSGGEWGGVVNNRSKPPQQQNHRVIVDDKNHNDNDEDEDPWIIPDRQLSTNSQLVSSNEWGEAVVPSTKSGESDDWETSAKDWFKSTSSSGEDVSSPTNDDGFTVMDKNHQLNQQQQQHHHMFNKKPVSSVTGNLSVASASTNRHPQTYEGPSGGGVPSVAAADGFVMNKTPYGDQHTKSDGPWEASRMDMHRDGDAEILKAAKDQSLLPSVDVTGHINERQHVAVRSPASSRQDMGTGANVTHIGRPISLAPSPRDAYGYHQSPKSHAASPSSTAIIQSHQSGPSNSLQAFEDSFGLSNQPLSAFPSSFGAAKIDDGFENFENVQSAFPVSAPSSARRKKDSDMLRSMRSGNKSDPFGFPQQDSPLAPGQSPQLLPPAAEEDDNDMFFDAMPPSSSIVDEPESVSAPTANISRTAEEAITNEMQSSQPLIIPSSHRSNPIGNHESDGETEDGKEEDEPKQKRRGFLGKLFGRGDKSKSTASNNSDSGSKRGKKSKNPRRDHGRKSSDGTNKIPSLGVALQENSRATNTPQETVEQLNRNLALNTDTQIGLHSTENYHTSQNIHSSQSKDTTVSDMTIPSVFKDVSRKDPACAALLNITPKEPLTPSVTHELVTPKASSVSTKVEAMHVNNQENFVDPVLDHVNMSDDSKSEEGNHLAPEASSDTSPKSTDSGRSSDKDAAKSRIHRHMKNRYTSLLVKDSLNNQISTQQANEKRRLTDRNPSPKAKTHNDISQSHCVQPRQVEKMILATKSRNGSPRMPSTPSGQRAEQKHAVVRRNITGLPAASVQVQSNFTRNLAARKNRSLTQGEKIVHNRSKPPLTAQPAVEKKAAAVFPKNRLPADNRRGVHHETIRKASSTDISTHSSSSYDAYQHLLSNSIRKARNPVQETLKDDFSARSGRTLTSHSSMESDVRVLREILRRPRIDDRERIMRSRSPTEFPVYDADSVSDPMQRAGLRLLSAAVIPIQAEVRRFLAIRRALTRMWALIVIQTYSRRFLAQNQYERSIVAITTIQAATRGHIARNNIITKHISAIEIQRYIRGYLATMRVYEEIYRVTLIQSWVRMRIAMDEAAYRMSLVIQLQAVCRGFLVRNRIVEQHKQATLIQTAWRCFYDRLTYQFDLLDIIIVQSLWRMKLSQRNVARLRRQRQEMAAIRIQTRWRAYDCRSVYVTYIAARKIQTKWRSYECSMMYRRYCAARAIQKTWRSHDCKMNYRRYCAARAIQKTWRSYDCKMNYLHFLADVLIVQSAFRRYMAQKKVKKLKNDAATAIQSAWRGFVCYADYEEYKLARKIQTAWRRYVCQVELKREKAATIINLACSKFLARLNARKDKAATVIQSAWRGFVCYADYMFTIADIVVAQKTARAWLARRVADQKRKAVKDKNEYHAAQKIQSAWRRFWCFSNFIISLDCAIQIQAQARRYLCQTEFLRQKAAAVRIQSAQRLMLAKKRVDCIKAASDLLSKSIDIGHREVNAASLIQRIYRGSIYRAAFTAHLAAIKIQKVVRGKQALVAVRLYLMARRIQRVWRGYIPRQVYLSFIAARRIQCCWRRYKAQDALLVNRGEYLAATLIQSSWRGFIAYTDYVFTLSDIVSAQKIARGYIVRKKYSPTIRANYVLATERRAAATTIQRHLRGYHARQRYWYTLGCTMQIQSWWRARSVELRIQREARALLTLQCFARRIIGRQKFLERKFIYMLIQTAEKERARKAAAIRIQEKMHSYLEQKQRDEAARVIQRFFLRVKYEVDQLVRAAKKRKKWRKKMMKSKNRTDHVEDALLEDAWMNAVSSTGGGADDEPFIRHYTHLKQSGSDTASCTHRTLASSMQSTGRHDGKGHGLPLGPSGLPRPDKPSTIVRLHHDDDETSVLSQLTSATMTYVHPSRVLHGQRNRKPNTMTDRNDDFQLEEAFIDAEIYHAKERRQMEGTSRSRDSSVRSGGGNQQHHLLQQQSNRKGSGVGLPSSGYYKRSQHYPPPPRQSTVAPRRNSYGGVGGGAGPGTISFTYSRGGGSVEGIGIERTWSRGSVPTRTASKDPDGTRHVPSRSLSSSSRGKNNAIVNVLSASNNY